MAYKPIRPVFEYTAVIEVWDPGINPEAEVDYQPTVFKGKAHPDALFCRMWIAGRIGEVRALYPLQDIVVYIEAKEAVPKGPVAHIREEFLSESERVVRKYS